MFERARPVRLAAMIGVLGLAVAGTAGDERQVLLALVATLPRHVLPGAWRCRSASASRPSISVTMLIIVWIGLGVAHAAMLRGLDHGGALVVMVLLGTFVGDTFAYFGGRLLGRRKLAPDLAQQDLGGPAVRDRRRHAGRLVLVADLRPATGSPAPTACCSAWRS